MGIKEVESSYDYYGQPKTIWYAGYLGYRTPAFSAPNKSIEHLLNENKFNNSWDWLMPCCIKMIRLSPGKCSLLREYLGNCDIDKVYKQLIFLIENLY